MEKREETRKQPINPKRQKIKNNFSFYQVWHITLDFYCLPYYNIVDKK